MQIHKKESRRIAKLKQFIKNKRIVKAKRLFFVLLVLTLGFSVGVVFPSILYPETHNPAYEALGSAMRSLGIYGVVNSVFLYAYNDILPVFQYVLHPVQAIRSQFEKPEQVYLDIPFKGMKQLEYKREIALPRNRLFPSSDDFVNAEFTYDGKRHSAEVRLKGDLPDHWEHKKRWSFRVELDEGSFKGMKVFSLQKPGTRDFLSEWYFYKFLKDHGLIATRYDFVEVFVNGESLGTYAYDEHQTKQMLEHNNRREGPIMKFDIFPFLLLFGGERLDPLELYSSFVVDLHKSTSTMRNEVIFGQFTTALALLEDFKWNRKRVAEVFDVEQTAKAFAIADLFGGNHPIHFGNSRLYFNPVTSRFEYIVRDLSGISLLRNEYWSMLGSEKQLGYEENLTQLTNANLEYRFFFEEDFFRAYVRMLEWVSNETLVDNFFATYEDEAEERERLIQRTYPYYEFNKKDILYQNQELIRYMVAPPKVAQPYLKNQNKTSMTLRVGNIHQLPIEIKRVRCNDVVLPPTQNVTLFVQAKQAYTSPDYRDFTFAKPAGFEINDTEADDCVVVYSVLGASTEHENNVIRWLPYEPAVLVHDVPRQPPNSDTFSFISKLESEKIITILPGTWELDRDIIFPPDYTITISDGVKLNLIKNASIISYSPFMIQGEEFSPVHVYSSDGSGQGIFVHAHGRKSYVNHVVFSNLGVIEKGSWQLTGAITFYESPIYASDVHIKNARAEDGINIIRSDFSISDVLIENTYSDCIDVDFGTGTCERILLVGCGNDGLDLSGSFVSCSDIDVIDAGDKGMSFGEETTAEINRAYIDRAYIGIASKDLSTVKGFNVNVNNTTFSIVSYQKKEEYGPADINLLQSNFNSATSVVGKGSQILVNNQPIELQHRENVYGFLYPTE